MLHFTSNHSKGIGLRRLHQLTLSLLPNSFSQLPLKAKSQRVTHRWVGKGDPKHNKRMLNYELGAYSNFKLRTPLADKNYNRKIFLLLSDCLQRNRVGAPAMCRERNEGNTHWLDCRSRFWKSGNTSSIQKSNVSEILTT